VLRRAREKDIPEPLLPFTRSFADECWLSAARQFEEKTKICNFDEILAC
jgi:hypothetical protein